MKQKFIHKNKVWFIESKGKSFTTEYGDYDYNLRTSTKKFDSEEKCEKEKEKIIRSKLKSRYEELSIDIEGVELSLLAAIHEIKLGRTHSLEITSRDKPNPIVLQEVCRLSTLEELKISSDQSMPDQMETLTALKKLELSENIVASIPDSIAKLKQLESLHLYGDYELTELSDAIFDIENLKELRISNLKKLQTLSTNIGQLQKLEVFEIKDCKSGFQEESGLVVPKEIGNLANLKGLTIEECNLDEIPQEVGNLTHLESLNLNNNRLKSLSKSIKELKKLTKLELYQNKLECIPTGVYELSSLIYLEIGYNFLEKIEVDFLKLTALKKFKFSVFTDTQKNIKNIPENILDSGLESIKDFLKNE
ncbi:leucine-rich repeat domain-containing protein [Aquimarina spinulae]|uniref:leucine-rich repeat domain-containing protein n=1 Tax=Aquimarina spinulae TaxID=1192023 RepID=UPI000D550B7A|nr:WGR domain-containing protein [Aquimarina spinulae]